MVDELDALGPGPEIHEPTGVLPIPFTWTTPLPRARNVVAVIEGSDPTGRVLPAAHCDSLPTGLDELPGYEPPPAEYYLLFSEVSVLSEHRL